MKLHAVPVEDLCPLVEYADDYPGLADLYADLDKRGMLHPIVAYRCTAEHYNRRSRCAEPAPTFSVLAVKFGNQRLKWARARGLRRVPVVMADCEGSAVRVAKALGIK